MKIAYFTDTYAPEVNGVTNTLAKLSGYLERQGIKHTFFAPDYDGSFRTDDAKANKTCMFPETKKVYRFSGIRVGISPNSCLAFPKAKRIFELCDKFAPDLVHVTTEFGIGHKGVKYAVSRKLPLVMSYHTDFCKYLGYFGLSSLEPFAERYLKRFYRHSDRTLAPSRYTMEQLRQKGYNNPGVWSRGIDTSKFNAGFRSEQARNKLGIGDNFAFLYVGRLSPEKGLHMLLHAIGKINSAFPGKAVFVFTGDGSYAETIRQAGYDNVIMTGFKLGNELAEIYASCDAFAFPSGTETFGNTCLEAMASGLPLAGISCGGVTDYLIHRENALLSEDGDQDGFTSHLTELMNNRQLCRVLKEKAWKTALSRDWDTIFDILLNEYETAIREKAPTAWERAS
ncbi:MAG: glycosyltransferase family 1 protein [Peptococcaceae bacterium]|nr:glycosyltransferase family 1 protein [Peptococcaceae bacterium]